MAAAVEGAVELEVSAVHTVHVPKHGLGLDIGGLLVGHAVSIRGKGNARPCCVVDRAALTLVGD